MGQPDTNSKLTQYPNYRRKIMAVTITNSRYWREHSNQLRDGDALYTFQVELTNGESRERTHEYPAELTERDNFGFLLNNDLEIFKSRCLRSVNRVTITNSSYTEHPVDDRGITTITKIVELSNGRTYTENSQLSESLIRRRNTREREANFQNQLNEYVDRIQEQLDRGELGNTPSRPVSLENQRLVEARRDQEINDRIQNLSTLPTRFLSEEPENPRDGDFLFGDDGSCRRWCNLRQSWLDTEAGQITIVHESNAPTPRQEPQRIILKKERITRMRLHANSRDELAQGGCDYLITESIIPSDPMLQPPITGYTIDFEDLVNRGIWEDRSC